MLTKPDVWESEEFRMKFSKIPRELQGRFLRNIQDLYKQESNSMLDFIRESRNSLRLTAAEIKDEQEVLQLTFKKLSDERSKSRIDVSSNPNPRREKSNLSTRSYPPQPRKHKPYCPSPEPMAHPGYPKPADKLPPLGSQHTAMHYENEMYDSDEDNAYFKEETQEIMRATSRAQNFHENERARQMEKIEQMKKQRQAKKEAQQDMAQELIREASMIEKQKDDQKKKHEQKVKEKLEKKKRQKEMTTGLGGTDYSRSASSASVLPDVDVNAGIVRTPRPTREPASLGADPEPIQEAAVSIDAGAGAEAAAADDDESSKKDKKKKKKDKKEKEKKEKKDKKSKKHKDKEEPIPADSPV